VPESESKPESTKSPEPKREPRDPRALSNEYHKARKQLMLWAGILFIWELVGIDLEKAKEAGGNFGSIISAIKSPQAVPWALLILVTYFLFKLGVEWHQCNPIRRSMKVARIDYLSAWIVAAVAYALYIIQAISRVQFADLLQDSSTRISLLCGFGAGFSLAAIVWRHLKYFTLQRVLSQEGSASWRQTRGESFQLRGLLGKLGVGLLVSFGSFLLVTWVFDVAIRKMWFLVGIAIGGLIPIVGLILFAWGARKITRDMSEAASFAPLGES
jgi:hypothetical protein